MSRLVADQLVDRIKTSPACNPESLHPVQLQGEPELVVLVSTLGFFNLDEISYLASAILEQEGISIDGTGFRYPTDELDSREAPLEGVEVYNPLGGVQVSIPAFERLIARYLRTLITEVDNSNSSITKQTSWPDVVLMTEKIEQRVLDSV